MLHYLQCDWAVLEGRLELLLDGSGIGDGRNMYEEDLPQVAPNQAVFQALSVESCALARVRFL